MDTEMTSSEQQRFLEANRKHVGLAHFEDFFGMPESENWRKPHQDAKKFPSLEAELGTLLADPYPVMKNLIHFLNQYGELTDAGARSPQTACLSLDSNLTEAILESVSLPEDVGEPKLGELRLGDILTFKNSEGKEKKFTITADKDNPGKFKLLDRDWIRDEEDKIVDDIRWSDTADNTKPTYQNDPRYINGQDAMLDWVGDVRTLQLTKVTRGSFTKVGPQQYYMTNSWTAAVEAKQQQEQLIAAVEAIFQSGLPYQEIVDKLAANTLFGKDYRSAVRAQGRVAPVQ